MPTVLHTESLRFGPGGQTIRLAREARRLNARPGWSCHVAGRSPGPMDRELGDEPWYHPFRFRKSKHDPGAFVRAVRLLRRLRPDVLHTHSSYDAWVFGLIPEDQDCHMEKPIILPMGRITPQGNPLTPEVLPVQILKVGNLAILGMPTEITTMEASGK